MSSIGSQGHSEKSKQKLENSSSMQSTSNAPSRTPIVRALYTALLQTSEMVGDPENQNLAITWMVSEGT